MIEYYAQANNKNVMPTLYGLIRGYMDPVNIYSFLQLIICMSVGHLIYYDAFM